MRIREQYLLDTPADVHAAITSGLITQEEADDASQGAFKPLVAVLELLDDDTVHSTVSIQFDSEDDMR